MNNFYSDTGKRKQKLLDKYLETLPQEVEINIGFEPDNEELFLYKADFRKPLDRKFKKEMGICKVWLISKVNDKYFIVDGSNEVIWIK